MNKTARNQIIETISNKEKYWAFSKNLVHNNISSNMEYLINQFLSGQIDQYDMLLRMNSYQVTDNDFICYRIYCYMHKTLKEFYFIPQILIDIIKYITQDITPIKEYRKSDKIKFPIKVLPSSMIQNTLSYDFLNFSKEVINVETLTTFMSNLYETSPFDNYNDIVCCILIVKQLQVKKIKIDITPFIENDITYHLNESVSNLSVLGSIIVKLLK